MRKFLKRHVGITIALALFIVGLQFSIRVRKPLLPVRQVIWSVAAVTFPVASLLSRTEESLGQFFDDYLFLAGVAKENRRLREDLDEARARVGQLDEVKRENERIKSLLAYGKQVGRKGVAARVISYDLSPWSNGFFIDVGENAGIQPGMAVVVPGGVAGKVYRVYPTNSFVISIIDHRFSLDARIQRTRLRCILKGTGSGCLLKYVRLTDDLQGGDMLVATGFEGSFPPGTPAGVVTRVDDEKGTIFKKVDLSPFVDLRKLESVYVLQLSASRSLTGRKR